MNQNMQISNITKDVVVTLAGKYQILPEKFIILTVLEYPQIYAQITLQKKLGWIDWKYVPVDYSKEEELSQEEVQPVSINTVSSEPISDVVVEKVSEAHPASPLISKRWSKLVKKQEGELKTNDSKGIV